MVMKSLEELNLWAREHCGYQDLNQNQTKGCEDVWLIIGEAKVSGFCIQPGKLLLKRKGDEGMGKENNKFIDGKECGRVLTLADLNTITKACDLIIGGMFAQGIENFTPDAMEEKLTEMVMQLVIEGKIAVIVDGDIDFLIGVISYTFSNGFTIASIQHKKVSTNKTCDISKFHEN